MRRGKGGGRWDGLGRLRGEEDGVRAGDGRRAAEQQSSRRERATESMRTDRGRNEGRIDLFPCSGRAEAR